MLDKAVEEMKDLTEGREENRNSCTNANDLQLYKKISTLSKTVLVDQFVTVETIKYGFLDLNWFEHESFSGN